MVLLVHTKCFRQFRSVFFTVHALACWLMDSKCAFRSGNLIILFQNLLSNLFTSFFLDVISHSKTGRLEDQ